ncbi:flagellar motor switch protein FliM [Neorhizobium sp. P12A]|jgi:flagellar motor switch protein FliM|uniref:FliM/FliN family flagellar motor switch protein n=1 Tax=Neorhizobium sp. P12A TaxID=2268027 RepID=UPI0011EC23AF|nr:FliM/FliN family flagellar motor switch protein [Neorhizobium sp. P12A]KAA0700062.1 flagellar motor switch protein FliM [Neorhizobium sp. P12A]
MSNETANMQPPMDRALLAKLTGGLGDGATVAKLSTSLANIYIDFLPDIIKSETGLDVSVTYAGCTSGLIDDLVGDLVEHHAVVEGSLRNWSPRFVLACGTGFVITLMEHMLGAIPDTVEEPPARPLSVIELDLAVMAFDKIGSVLRSAVNAPGGFEPIMGAPFNIEEPPKNAEEHPEEFGAAVKMTITLGSVATDFYVIIPQKVLLKTVISAPRAKSQSAKSQEWTDMISEQVRRSQVTLEARIRLQSLTIDTISRLAEGDVIPFMDSEDVRVEVSANSKDLYICEFGRSGENYTVRVKDNISSDDDLLKHLMN